jgi:glycerol-3-phosphate cytidylyltransferase
VQSLIERYIQLDAVRYVDEVIPYSTEEEMHNLLRILRINVRIVGEEYRSVFLSGQDVCEELGIQIYYNSRTHQLSSSELRERVLRAKLN